MIFLEVNKSITSTILSHIEKGEEISPFLFVGGNKDLLNNQVQELSKSLLQELSIPEAYLYTFEDDGTTVKINDIKRFVEIGSSLPPYKIQIFIIENISRFTIASGNSLLKFFEEPGSHNLILLTNSSESGVLETILSRSQVHNLGLQQTTQKDAFFYDLIDNYIQKKDMGIFGYFFRTKIEKEDAILFLNNLILYSTETLNFTELLEEIDTDINLIQKNNVSAKYIIDKYLLLIK